MLNTAQMRDAIYIQHFRIRPQPLDRQRALEEGAAREVNSQKAVEADTPSRKGKKGTSARQSAISGLRNIASASTLPR